MSEKVSNTIIFLVDCYIKEKSSDWSYGIQSGNYAAEFPIYMYLVQLYTMLIINLSKFKS